MLKHEESFKSQSGFLPDLENKILHLLLNYFPMRIIPSTAISSSLLVDFENNNLSANHFFSISVITEFFQIPQVIRNNLFFELLILSTSSFLFFDSRIHISKWNKVIVFGILPKLHVFNFKATQKMFRKIFQYTFDCSYSDISQLQAYPFMYVSQPKWTRSAYGLPSKMTCMWFHSTSLAWATPFVSIKSCPQKLYLANTGLHWVASSSCDTGVVLLC